MAGVVLDASAVLALLQAEPGADRVEAVLGEAVMSAVNYCEVVGKLSERGVPRDVAAALLAHVSIEVVDFDEAQAAAAGSLRQATAAGALRQATRPLGLSLGDRACLALAEARGAVAITMDRAWRELDIGVTIECLRPA